MVYRCVSNEWVRYQLICSKQIIFLFVWFVDFCSCFMAHVGCVQVRVVVSGFECKVRQFQPKYRSSAFILQKLVSARNSHNGVDSTNLFIYYLPKST